MPIGLPQPGLGEILIDGQPVRFASPLEARRSGIETVYQDLALADQLTVWQNVFLNRELTWGPKGIGILRRAEMRRRSQDLVQRLAVNVPSATRTVKRLSGGQRQAIAIARAVMWSRQFVIMDEPTAALGLRETAQVEDLIRRIVDEGTSVLIISHNFEQVMRLAQQVWVMRAGEVVNGERVSDISGVELVAQVTGAAGMPPSTEALTAGPADREAN
ncbi:sugar ABC transporter ATP-binding protein [Luteimicrobium album]|uniref:Sugar ABC transporter ATP-binding protein n=1 Tax=Luteimicrobium album TaxID=1054550 RepID=A0ABQ6HXU4_9MICO|nr:ATP-binding cassette domain-containing protein [Luteimicrobium album]GMA23321.1 sugar ABC transporter ATP-binding protein [Luteimicrobium album]